MIILFLWSGRFFSSIIIQIFLEFHDLDIEIRPELPQNGGLLQKGSSRSFGISNRKAEQQVLKIAEKDTDAIKSNGTLGTKVLLHVDDKAASTKARSMKESVDDAKRKKDKKIQTLIRGLISG